MKQYTLYELNIEIDEIKIVHYHEKITTKK